jgi:hypothetical protein
MAYFDNLLGGNGGYNLGEHTESKPGESSNIHVEEYHKLLARSPKDNTGINANPGLSGSISKHGAAHAGGGGGSAAADDHRSFFGTVLELIISHPVIQKLLVIFILAFIGYPLAFGIRWSIGKEDFGTSEETSYSQYEYRTVQKQSFFKRVFCNGSRTASFCDDTE